MEPESLEEDRQHVSYKVGTTGHPPLSSARRHRLERHVADSALPIAGPFRLWMGTRATLPDRRPAIGRSTRAVTLFYAIGHQHLGLTLAPVTGELVAALITGDAPVIDLAPFPIERF